MRDCANGYKACARVLASPDGRIPVSWEEQVVSSISFTPVGNKCVCISLFAFIVIMLFYKLKVK